MKNLADQLRRSWPVNCVLLLLLLLYARHERMKCLQRRRHHNEILSTVHNPLFRFIAINRCRCECCPFQIGFGILCYPWDEPRTHAGYMATWKDNDARSSSPVQIQTNRSTMNRRKPWAAPRYISCLPFAWCVSPVQQLVRHSKNFKLWTLCYTVCIYRDDVDDHV